MDVPAILAIIGGVALLVGLFGGGVKAKEIEVPSIPRWSRFLSFLIGVVLIGTAIWLSRPVVSPEPTATPEPLTSTPTVGPSDTPGPKPTNTPSPTNTLRPIPTPAATIDADPTVYDNFNNSEFDGKWNTGLWTDTSYPGIISIEQENSRLIISRQSPESSILRSLRPGKWTIDQLGFVEAKVMLDSNIEASGGAVAIGIDKFTSQNNWMISCDISGGQGNIEAWANCHTDGSIHGSYSANGFTVQYNTWHTMRFEIYPDTAIITFFIDGQQIGSYIPTDLETFKKTQFSLELFTWSKDGGLVTGYIDDVRVGK